MKNLKILQKKKLIFIVFFILILLSSNVQASVIATIAKTGLQFAAPEIAQAVNTAICITNLVACAQAKIMGHVTSKAYEAAYEAVAEIAGEETAREIANAINTYNQIKGYLDKGSEILEELKLNEKGEVEKGILHSKEDAIGNLINKDLDKDTVIITNIDFNFETKEAIFKENGKLKIEIEKDGEQIERVYENIKENGIIILNENGDVEEANIVTSKKAEFIFGDNPKIYNIPTDTRITYKDGIIRVYGKDKNFNLLSHGEQSVKIGEDIVSISADTIKGKDFWIGDIHFGRFDTTSVKIIDKGYLLKNGLAEYKKIKVSLEPTWDTTLLIANLNADLSDYEGNWIKINSKKLEVQSWKGVSVDLEFLPGNELFNMNKIKFENGKRKEIPDEKDLLEIRISEGDYLRVINREHRGLIPKIEHRNNGGYIDYIKTGRFTFSLDKTGLKMEAKRLGAPLLGHVLFRAEESVPFQLSSDLIDQELRVNSGNQFVLLTPETKEKRVVLNEFSIPVSEKIKDNELQTLSYFREKWKDIGIEFYAKAKPMFLPLLLIEEEEVFPHTLQIVDYWLKQNPNIDLDSISFLPGYGTTGMHEEYNEEEGRYTYHLLVGANLVDPYFVQEEKGLDRDREFIPTYSLLNHEYRHVQDTKIWREDLKAIERLSNKRRVSLTTEFLYSIDEEIRPLVIYYNKIAEEGLERLQSDSKYKDIIDKIYEKIKRLEKEGLEEASEIKNTKKKLINLIENSRKKSREPNPSYLIPHLSLLGRKDPELATQYLRLQEEIKKMGFPATYSFITYKKDIDSFNKIDLYEELSTIWAEEPIELRKQRAQFGNENQQKVYKALTQLSLDADIISPKEYQDIIGIECKTITCLEYRCLQYKLLCCEKYPTSPNC